MHEKYREWIQLMLYGELDEEQLKELNSHIHDCPDCSAELGAMKRFHSFLEKSPAYENLLNEARQQLRGALRVKPSSPVTDFFESVQRAVFGHYKVALGGAALMGIGVFLGTLIVPSRQQTAPQLAPQIARQEDNLGDVRITNVRFLNPEPESGEVEFVFDAVKSVRLKGNINEEKIQKILTHAMINEQNPGVRLKSVSAFASRIPADRVVKVALITAMKSDENPGVRQEALRALRNYPFDADIKSGFLFVLTHDVNPALRIAAINQLDSSSAAAGNVDQDLLSVLKEKMRTDENNYVRLRARAVVEGVNQ